MCSGAVTDRYTNVLFLKVCRQDISLSTGMTVELIADQRNQTRRNVKYMMMMSSLRQLDALPSPLLLRKDMVGENKKKKRSRISLSLSATSESCLHM